MPLVKRDNGVFKDSYEIESFFVDLGKPEIVVHLSKYSIKDNGIPFTEKIMYPIRNEEVLEIKNKYSEEMFTERNEDGSLKMDDSGNPVLKAVQVEKEYLEKVDVKKFDEVMIAITSGQSIYKEVRKALYDSFEKYYLKDETYNIE